MVTICFEIDEDFQLEAKVSITHIKVKVKSLFVVSFDLFIVVTLYSNFMLPSR